MENNVTNNAIHLCDSCVNECPSCGAVDVLFGDGTGCDNICCCNQYEPLWTRQQLEIVNQERNGF